MTSQTPHMLLYSKGLIQTVSQLEVAMFFSAPKFVVIRFVDVEKIAKKLFIFLLMNYSFSTKKKRNKKMACTRRGPLEISS